MWSRWRKGLQNKVLKNIPLARIIYTPREYLVICHSNLLSYGEKQYLLCLRTQRTFPINNIVTSRPVRNYRNRITYLLFNKFYIITAVLR